MSMSKKYWRGLPELHNSAEFQANHKNEFAEPLPIDEFLNSDEAEKVKPLIRIYTLLLK